MSRRRLDGPRAVVAIVVSLAAVAAVVAILAASGERSDVARPGDVLVRARRNQWRPQVVTVPAGEVGVVVRNDDFQAHDFTMHGVVAVHVPGRSTRRLVVKLAPGEHRFVCTLHPSMTGVLRAAASMPGVSPVGLGRH